MKCCEFTAGSLRNEIELQSITRTPDGLGGYTETWATYATVRAQINPLSGGERLQAMKLESTVTHKCIIRYRDDVNAADRVRYRGVDFQIRAVWDIEERHRWLNLDLEEGVAAFGS